MAKEITEQVNPNGVHWWLSKHMPNHARKTWTLAACSVASQKSKRKSEPDGRHGRHGRHGRPGVVVLSCSLRIERSISTSSLDGQRTYARSLASLLWHRPKDKVLLCLRYCVMQHGLHRDMLGLPRLEHCPCVFGSTIFTCGLIRSHQCSHRCWTTRPAVIDNGNDGFLLSSFVPTFMQPDWTCSKKDRIWLWFFSTTYFT